MKSLGGVIADVSTPRGVMSSDTALVCPGNVAVFGNGTGRPGNMAACAIGAGATWDGPPTTMP